jgi:SNF2 family DNA or RNA helicase
VDCGTRNRFLVRNNNGEVFISHNSAGHGLNIQHGGSMIVWFSLSWSLEYYQQFNARLYRQGQTMAVRIIHLICKGCIDERIINVLKDKDIVQSDLLRALK